MIGSEHSLHSSQRENLLEHLFAGEVMRQLWLLGVYDLEVMKPQVDDSGYDLVFESGRVVRHVQLKSTARGSSLSSLNVNVRLSTKPSGCVILIQFEPATLALGPFYRFGGAPGDKLPDISGLRTAKHTKANAKGVKLLRPNIRQLPLSKLKRLNTIQEVIGELFVPDTGHAPNLRSA